MRGREEINHHNGSDVCLKHGGNDALLVKQWRDISETSADKTSIPSSSAYSPTFFTNQVTAFLLTDWQFLHSHLKCHHNNTTYHYFCKYTIYFFFRKTIIWRLPFAYLSLEAYPAGINKVSAFKGAGRETDKAAEISNSQERFFFFLNSELPYL